MYSSSQREEEDAQMCPCGKAVESITDIVGECEIYNQEREVLKEMRKIDESGIEKFGTLDRWWPRTAKQEGDKISKKFLRNTSKKTNERPNVGGVSISSRKGAPSRKGCVVNGQMTINKASNK